jgi:anti-sigma factor RsiW
MMNQVPLTDADLHAYLDGELPATRRAEIEAYLADHADAAERVNAYREQKLALKALFDPVLTEPLPESLRRQAEAARPAMRQTSVLSRWSLQRMAASVAIAVVGGALGWGAHGRYHADESLALRTPLPRQAAIAHVVFSPDVRRPVEVGADQEDQLVTWLSKRLGTPVRPPKLGALGYELIGGRLLPGNIGPVAQFMYHDASGQRLTLYVSTEIGRNQDTAFRFAKEGPVNVFYWIDGKFGYALSAGISKNELSRVATAVYEQLEKN